MSTPIIELCLACLFHPPGQLLGVGFLAAQRWILTAAHVIQGLPAPILGAQVEVAFPLAETNEKRTAWVRGYFPDGTSPGGDIAVLELGEDPPAGVHPARLAPSRHVRKHTFYAYGFPEGNDRGSWATGEILGPQAGGWLQIEAIKAVGQYVRKGFSGAPLGDHQRKGVIGMILEAERDIRTGYALSIEAIIERWPDLPAPSPLLTQIPPLPPHYLPRPAALAALKAAVLSDAQPITVLHGMGGAGKTVLAAALTQDKTVQDAFPDGIVRIDLGDLIRRTDPDMALPPDPILSKRQDQVAEALGEEGTVFRDSREGRDRLEEILRQKACLIILDNGWEPEHIHAFTCPVAESRLLVTTRDAGLAAGLPAALVPLDVLDDEQAAVLLVAAGGDGAPDELEEIRQVARKCGNLPLALAMAGALREEMDWQDILDLLINAELDLVNHPLIGYPYPSLLGALKVSFETLGPKERDHYQDFVLFPLGPIPQAVLEVFWTSLGLSSPRIKATLGRLQRRSLLRRDDEGQISLHDLQHDYLRLSVSEPEQAERRTKLLDALRAQVQDGKQPEPARRLAAIWLTRLRWLDHIRPQPAPQELIPYLDLLVRLALTQPEIEYLLDKAIYPALEAHAGELDHRKALRLHHLAAALHGKLADLLPKGADRSRELELAARDFAAALDRLALLAVSDPLPSDPFLAARLRFVAGNVQRMRGQFPEAVALYTQAVEDARAFGQNKILITVILKEQAYAHALQREWGLAEAQIEQAYQTLRAEAAELAPGLGLSGLPQDVLALPAFQAICETFAKRPPKPGSEAGEAFEGLKELAAAYADVLETHTHIYKGRAETGAGTPQAPVDWAAAVRLAQDSLGYLEPLNEISLSLVYAHMNAAEYLLSQARQADPSAAVPEAACRHWRTALLYAQRLGLGHVAKDAQNLLDQKCR